MMLGTWKPESERHIGEVQQELGDLKLVEDGQQI
jgi:alpha 1,6-mannosyltransferase